LRTLTKHKFAAAALLFASTNLFAQAVIGEPAPEFLGRTFSGEDFKLSAYKGKVVVASFWASWCGPCRHELPLLEGMQKVLGPDKVKVVAISIEDRDSFRQIHKAAGSLNLEFIHDYNGSVSKEYGRQSVPQLIVVGKDGTLLKKFVGYSEQQADRIVAQVQAAIEQA
jgi:thiol-disulfide isomerase/thioredoxin